MQVRLPTIEIDENARRAIRFVESGRQTMCSRKDAQKFLLDAQRKGLKDALYRLYGTDVPAAVLAGADADSYGSDTEDDVKTPVGADAV